MGRAEPCIIEGSCQKRIQNWMLLTWESIASPQDLCGNETEFVPKKNKGITSDKIFDFKKMLWAKYIQIHAGYKRPWCHWALFVLLDARITNSTRIPSTWIQKTPPAESWWFSVKTCIFTMNVSPDKPKDLPMLKNTLLKTKSLQIKAGDHVVKSACNIECSYQKITHKYNRFHEILSNHHLVCELRETTYIFRNNSLPLNDFLLLRTNLSMIKQLAIYL